MKAYFLKAVRVRRVTLLLADSQPVCLSVEDSSCFSLTVSFLLSWCAAPDAGVGLVIVTS
jgi:hypothetical protein